MTDLETACELLASIGDEIHELNQKTDQAFERRHIPIGLIYRLVGEDMINKGQKTKTVGDFTVRVSMKRILICKCHRASVGECDNRTPEIMDGGDRPSITVYRSALNEAVA